MKQLKLKSKQLINVINSDSLTYLNTIKSDSVHSMVTDPPAGIGLLVDGIGFNGDREDRYIKFDCLKSNRLRCNAKTRYVYNLKMKNQLGELLSPIFMESLRILKPGSFGVVWAYPRTSHWTAEFLEASGFEIVDVITNKIRGSRPKGQLIGRRVDGWDGWSTTLKVVTEHWILVRKPSSELTYYQNILKHGTGAINISQTDMWTTNNISYKKRDNKNIDGIKNTHPTPKSIALMSFLVKLVTPINGICLDPFMGSGSTGYAAIVNGFSFIGIEINKEYYNIAKQRIESANRRILESQK